VTRGKKLPRDDEEYRLIAVYEASRAPNRSIGIFKHGGVASETLLDDLAEATLDGTRKEHMEFLVTVPLLILDDLGMRKLPLTAAEELLEIIMRRYERASTMLTSNRPVEDWGKLLGDAAAVSAILDRLLHHGHVLKCGPRSWRTKTDLPPQEAAGWNILSPGRPIPLAGFEVITVGRF
jgi:hypothetical protein